MRYILIDGYNVIRADPRLLSLERASLETARRVLVQTVASAPRLSGDRITVVFDGARGARGHVHGHKLGRVDVLYSARGQSADDVIVAQAQRLSGQGRVVVVSNDVAVREHCRAAGCEVSGSENLLAQMPGRMPARSFESDDDDFTPTLSTAKRGNPRRRSRRDRRHSDIRF